MGNGYLDRIRNYLPMSKLRKSARDQDCTLQIFGVCNSNPETTVLAHLPDESGTGKMGGKSDDWIACFACSDCHDMIDGRRNNEFSKTDREWYEHRAMMRTWRKWIDMGLIKL